MPRTAEDAALSPLGSDATEAASPRRTLEQFWPAPLTAIEWFMVASEEPGYPLTFFSDFVFQGILRRPEFEEALRVTLERHPLAISRLERNPAGGLAWVDGRDTPTTIDWASAGAPLEPAPAIDLERETGVRAWVRVGNGKTWLRFETHHAVSDGHGGMRFLEDLLVAYAAIHAGRSPEETLSPIDSRRLARRGAFDTLAGAEPWQAVVARVMRHASEYLGVRPRPLAGSGPPASRSSLAPAMLTHSFDEARSSSVRTAIAREPGTLNDHALAIALRLLAAWNERHDPRADQGRLRVLVPVDLRGPGDERMPAANVLTFSFVTRRAVDCQNTSALCAGLTAEMALIQRERLGTAFLHAMAGLRLVPGALSLITRSTSCQATAVLSNVGDPTRRFQARLPREQGRLMVGDLRLESITAAPPLRRGTRAAFLISAYAGRIVLSLRTDPRFISPDDAQSLMRGFVEGWRELCGPSDVG